MTNHALKGFQIDAQGLYLRYVSTAAAMRVQTYHPCAK
jgi:hypothetical protein